MIDVIIYSRVSTDEQADKGYSLRSQEEKMQVYCKFLNYNIVKHFQEDFSAKTFDRPQFIQLLQYLKANKNIRKLILLKWDRFSRNVSDALNMLKTLRLMNVEVIAIEQPIDINIPEQKMMLSIYLTAPEIENDRRSLNTMSGMRRAQREGRWVASAPSGYSLKKDERNKTILVKNEKAKLVVMAYELYASGNYHLEEVRRIMNKKGLNIGRSQFWNFLRNPIYIGKIVIKAYGNEEEEIVDGIHEAIVSKELFHKVQDVADSKARAKTRMKKVNSTFPLRGHLICPKCNKVLTASQSKGNGGQYSYYHCQSGCKERQTTSEIHETFLKMLKALTLKPKVAELYHVVLLKSIQTQRSNHKLDKNVANEKISTINKKIERVDEKYIDDGLDKETYKRLLSKYKKEISDLQSQILGDTIPTTNKNEIENGLGLLTNLRKFYDEASIEIKQKLISSIFPEKLIYQKKTYRTTKPSEILRLLYATRAGSGAFRKKENRKKLNSSGKVAPTGIEPASKV